MRILLFIIVASFLFSFESFAEDLSYSRIQKLYHVGTLNMAWKPGIELDGYIKQLNGSSNDFLVHWEISRWANKYRQYGTSLFALKKASMVKEGDPEVSFNIGVLLCILGLPKVAIGRFEYVANSKNFFLKNRAIAILMRLEDGGTVDAKDMLDVY